MNKADQSILFEPHCNINKLTKYFECPINCKWFEKGGSAGKGL